MPKKRIAELFLILAVGSVFFIFFRHPVVKPKIKQRKNKTVIARARRLEIENYIVTKTVHRQATIRIYGINKSGNRISHFPVVIQYYSKMGKSLGKDDIDLLTTNSRVLKPYGKVNARIDITYPEMTKNIKVRVKQ